MRLEPKEEETEALINPSQERRAKGPQSLSESSIPVQLREFSELPTDEPATIFTTAESKVLPGKPVSFFNQNQPLLSTIAELFYLAPWGLPAGLARAPEAGTDGAAFGAAHEGKSHNDSPPTGYQVCPHSTFRESVSPTRVAGNEIAGFRSRSWLMNAPNLPVVTITPTR